MNMFFFLMSDSFESLMFFFQAEDGIRDATVTGVQTCALPICVAEVRLHEPGLLAAPEGGPEQRVDPVQHGVRVEGEAGDVPADEVERECGADPERAVAGDERE